MCGFIQVPTKHACNAMTYMAQSFFNGNISRRIGLSRVYNRVNFHRVFYCAHTECINSSFTNLQLCASTINLTFCHGWANYKKGCF